MYAPPQPPPKKKKNPNTEKQEQSWRTHISWFQNLLQSYSN